MTPSLRGMLASRSSVRKGSNCMVLVCSSRMFRPIVCNIDLISLGCMHRWGKASQQAGKPVKDASTRCETRLWRRLRRSVVEVHDWVRPHICHWYHRLYPWRNICHVEKFQISVKNLNNLWCFIEIYAFFVLNLRGENLCGEKLTNMRSDYMVRGGW